MAFVQITWIDSVTVGVTGYNIYRDNVLLSAVGVGVENYIDDTASYETTHKYVVQAVDPFGESNVENLGVNYENITLGVAPTLYEFNASFTDRTWISFSGSDVGEFVDGDFIELTYELDNVSDTNPLLCRQGSGTGTYLSHSTNNQLFFRNVYDGSNTLQTHSINTVTTGTTYTMRISYGSGTSVNVSVNGSDISSGVAYVTRNPDQLLARDTSTSVTNQFFNGKLKSVNYKGFPIEFRSTATSHTSLFGDVTLTFHSETGTTISTLFTPIV